MWIEPSGGASVRPGRAAAQAPPDHASPSRDGDLLWPSSDTPYRKQIHTATPLLPFRFPFNQLSVSITFLRRFFLLLASVSIHISYIIVVVLLFVVVVVVAGCGVEFVVSCYVHQVFGKISERIFFLLGILESNPESISTFLLDYWKILCTKTINLS